jgi:4-hydroxy-3-methylbut-2-en-1-yl diphosphate synthase IspG/GcpE
MLAGFSPMPVVADIHFDWRIALRCMDFPIAKVRINPGNIGAEWKVREVAAKALDKGIPIRIGINGGSLPKDLDGEVYEHERRQYHPAVPVQTIILVFHRRSPSVQDLIFRL